LSKIVYVNGEFLAEDMAKVSIFDRGFLFGDGVYEVVPVVDSKIADKAYFAQRLQRSLAELELDMPCSMENYLSVHQQLIQRNKLQEGYIYSQVTRGVAPRDFHYPQNTATTFVAFSAEKNILKNELADTGIKVISTQDLRWKRRDIKSINLLGQCMAKQDAISRGGQEGWMLEQGFVTEGVSSTAYIVKDNTLITRPLSNSILPGIRRRTLLELAAANRIAVQERAFTLDEALAADEALISSATTLVLPVVSIDDNKIGSGVPGPLTLRLRGIYIENMLASS